MKVTKEMIGAAHDICLKKCDFVLSADLLERIYLAMDALANHDETSGPPNEQLAALQAENEKLREDYAIRVQQLSDVTLTMRELQANERELKATNEKLREDAERNNLDRLGKECLRIGQQLQRAAGELPEGFILRVEVEKGAGWVEVYDDKFDLITLESAGEGLSIDISSAVDAARKGE